MLASVYLFGELGAGYTQYLDDYTREMFKKCAKQTRTGTQLLIHREENTVYYIYIRKLIGGKYIGMCYVVSGLMITAYKQLFEIFERTVDTIVTRGVILEFTDDGKITSSLDKLHLCKAEFAQIADYLKMQFEHIVDSHIEPLPPIDYSINTQESKTYNLSDGLSEVKNTIGLYSYVYILKGKDYETESLKSYSNILRTHHEKIKNLEKKNTEYHNRAIKAENAQRNTKWVAILALIAVVLFGVIYFKVINPSEVTKKDMGQFMYYGPMKNGEPNGTGVAIYHSDDEDGRLYYYGNFNNGMRIDQNAIMFYKDGSYYKGSMNEDKWDEGIFYDISENVYFKGTFVDNKANTGDWYKCNKVQSIESGKNVRR